MFIKLKNTQGPAQVNNPKPKAETQLHKSFVSKRYCSSNYPNEHIKFIVNRKSRTSRVSTTLEVSQ